MNLFLNLKVFWNRWILNVVNPYTILRSIKLYRQYLSDWHSYFRFPSAESLRFIDSYPCIYECTKTALFDSHYFCRVFGLSRKIKGSGVKNHLDVGPEISRSFWSNRSGKIYKNIGFDTLEK